MKDDLKKAEEEKDARISQLERSKLELQKQADEERCGLEANFKNAVDAKRAGELQVLELDGELAEEKKFAAELQKEQQRLNDVP